MKRTALLLSAAVLAGSFRPAMRHDCEGAVSACAPRPAATSCHRAEGPSCHKKAAPEKQTCPGMVCCIVQEDRAAVAAVSVAPHLSDEGIVLAAVPSAEILHVSRFSSSPSPPGGGPSQIGFLSPSSPRGPPVLA